MDLTVQGVMHGKKAMRKLQEIDPDIKTIISTGYTDDPIKTRFREHGFNGMITKPYKLEKLHRALRELINPEDIKSA